MEGKEKKSTNTIKVVVIVALVALIIGLIIACVSCDSGDDTPTNPSTSTNPTESKPTEPKPTEPKPTEPKPTEPKPTEPKPTEPKPTEPKPTEPKPTEPKPTEPKPTEPKPTEPKPTEPKPTEPKPTEPKPTEPKPTEPKPTEPKPTEPKPTEPKPTEPVEPAGTEKVNDADELDAALKNPDVDTIVLNADITLDRAFVIDRDVTIDLNGHKLTTVTDVVYPDASTVAINKDCTVTIKNGTINDVATKVDGGIDFIRVFSGAVLNLEKVNVNITVSPLVVWNDTMDRWQTNSAEHNIFIIGSNASVNLTDSNVDVVSPKVVNFSKYTRRPFAIVGVCFSQSSSNTQFVMDGGSFNIKVTEPLATDSTDTLYFAKAERRLDKTANATNKLEVKGDAVINLGGLNSAGKINSNNCLFWLGTGYYNGKTYGSGLKTIALSADTTINMDGLAYSLKAAKEWDVEGALQAFGTKNAQLEAYNIEEIKYQFVCTDKAFGCTHEVELTVKEVANHVNEWGTRVVDGVALPKCPHCQYGGLQLKNV